MGETDFRTLLVARCRAAAARPGALWVQAACLASASTVAWYAATRLAAPGDDLDRARRLGIVSATTLAGYAKSRDTRAYAIALAVSVIGALALWIAWACASNRGAHAAAVTERTAPPSPASPWRWSELAVVAALLLPGLLRFDLAANGWDAPYTFYAEEGEAVAWAQVALHGGVLARDVYCLYGPLATYPVVAAFDALGPSVHLWRLCVYLLDLPALLAVFLLLRILGGSRTVAALGVALVLFHRMWPMPAMSWCLLRTGLGLAAIAGVAQFLRANRSRALVAAGALVGVSVFFSQEAGVAAAMAVAVALALDHARRAAPWTAAARKSLLVAAGFAAVAAPVLIGYASRGAVAALIQNLFGFAELRVLGHGGQLLPDPRRAVAAWLAVASPEALDTLLEALSVYVAPALYVVASFRVGARLLSGRYETDLAVHAALIVFGAVLFVSPLSRPDTTHVLFAMPPAFVLAVDLSARAAALVSKRGGTPAPRCAAAAFLATALAGMATLRTDTGENVALFAKQVALNVTGRGSSPAEEGSRPLDLPRAGGIRIPTDRADEIEAVVRYVREATGPNEPVWAFPNEPMLNFLADRPLANPYPLSLFAITRDQRLDLIAAVERSGVRYAIVNRKPSMVDAIPSRDQVPELWSHLEARFVVERRFGRFVVMRRAADAAR